MTLKPCELKGACHVIIASNIAESSLTIGNVSTVIDFGLRRAQTLGTANTGAGTKVKGATPSTALL